jgi:hypothetical protein
MNRSQTGNKPIGLVDLNGRIAIHEKMGQNN